MAGCCAASTVREISRPHLHRMGGIVVSGMTIKISAMTGDTLAPSRMAIGTADQCPIGCAMTEGATKP